MRGELGHLEEGLLAHGADVVPNAAMLFDVLAEGGVATEGLAALATRQRLLSRVKSNMNLSI